MARISKIHDLYMQALIQKAPPNPPGSSYILFEQFWVEAGPESESQAQDIIQNFVMTPSIATHLCNIARAVLLRKYPILLQVDYTFNLYI